MRNGLLVLLIFVLSGCLKESSVDPHFHPGILRRLASEIVVSSNGTVITSVAFGALLLGTDSTLTLNVENNGESDATGISATLSSDQLDFLGGVYPGTGGTCSSQLDAGTECTVVLVYTPSSVSTLTATLTLSYADGEGDQSDIIALTGSAVNPGILSVSDTPSYDFGDVLQDIGTEKAFTLTNSGSYEISDIQITGLSAPFSIRGSYPGTCGNCTTTLATGASCTLAITYRPTTATTHSGSFTISYESGVETETTSVNLTGTAIDPDSVIPGPPDPDDFPPPNICR